jgi:hypothetical protein
MQPCFSEDEFINLVDVNYRTVTAVILDTTNEVVKIRKKIDGKVSEVSKDTLSSESLKLVSSWENSKLTEPWEHKSIRADSLVSCSLPKGSFSASFNDRNFTITIDFPNQPGAQRKTGSLSVSATGLLYKINVRDEYKSPNSFKEDWMKSREKEMSGMPVGQLEEYKKTFTKYKFDPVNVGLFKGFVWGREDQSERSIFLTTGKNFLTGRLENFDRGPMTLELALKIISSVSVLHLPDRSVVSLSDKSVSSSFDLTLKPSESGLQVENESRKNEELKNSTGETATSASNMNPNKETASPAITAMQMAETDPEAFLEMLRKRLLDELIKESDKKSLVSIKKFESFLLTVQNEKTRSRAQAMLDDLKENYSSTWHLLYPIQLSNRWHEIKGQPVAKIDFTEILGLAGVSACDRESVPEAMKPVADLKLFGPVNYLDPLQEAVLKLSNAGNEGYKFKSTKATSLSRLESAGFPLDTFNYYSYDVEHPEDSVNRIFFVVDNYMRVVAFQEVIESPKSVRMSSHNNTRSVFNFVQMRRKGTGTYKIAYENRYSFGTRSSSRGGSVCVLTSELVDSDRKPREWVRLHLPRRLAEVCMYICKEVND